ncbi:MAG: hypothetical protein ACOH5I_12685 [Oligoflexus sp.]
MKHKNNGSDPLVSDTRFGRGERTPPKRLWLFFLVPSLLLVFASLSWFYKEDLPTDFSEMEEDHALPAGKSGTLDTWIGIINEGENEVVQLTEEIDPLSKVGQLVRVQGTISKVLTSSAFILSPASKKSGTNSEILIIYLMDDVVGQPPVEGGAVLVQGEMLAFELDRVESLVGPLGENKRTYGAYVGKPTIIAASLAF